MTGALAPKKTSTRAIREITADVRPLLDEAQHAIHIWESAVRRANAELRERLRQATMIPDETPALPAGSVASVGEPTPVA